ncbi:hypothetical protein FRC09_009237 [Ceratobasidium sp. 395]|nr:hypothetical protein FRC09_009237 [Ceratobasidium sp. 395]
MSFHYTWHAMTPAQRHSQGILESVKLSNYFHSYAPVMRQGEGLVYASPSILECKFRLGIELEHTVKEDGDTFWKLKPCAQAALHDALLQVRHVVGTFCKTLEESEGHLLEWDPGFSPLNCKFRAADIVYPFEPVNMFLPNFWNTEFDFLHDLVEAVVGAQIWGLWMICTLHVYAATTDPYMRESVYDALPPYLMVHYMKAAEAYDELSKDKVSHGLMPWVNDYGVPLIPEVLQHVIASALSKASNLLGHVACPLVVQEPHIPSDPESFSESGDESSLTDYDYEEDDTPMIMICRPASAML